MISFAMNVNWDTNIWADIPLSRWELFHNARHPPADNQLRRKSFLIVSPEA